MVKLNRENLLRHINDPNDLIELRKIIDKAEIVINDYVNLTSDFLNPHEIKKAAEILNSLNLSYSVYGGYDQSELSVISMGPEYLEEPTNFDIRAFKFNSMSGIKHKNVLGSILGLGIDRRKIGDILIGKDFTYFFAKNEISDFIFYNLEKISNYNVSLIETEDGEDFPKKEYNEREIIISSRRLDAFLSQALKIPRSKAASLISQNQVKVNFTYIDKSSYMLNENDLVSVRRYGRIIFSNIEKTTKKDKLLVKIKIPK
ncbi:YlmH/Sll1252 family protein [uncultured Peptoniphilus sp.]|uniref:YlmH family RNA-binding protein n=1 Tax=uncultured Peptoniphilus sp. TaxID=254354 RepID=UPI002803E57B|nr:YlmH/Sll1252 family protein [uncultured Peptoniphilus sp.]